MTEALLDREKSLAEIEEMLAEFRSRKSSSGIDIAMEAIPRISRFKGIDNEVLFRKLIEVETSVYGPASTVESDRFIVARSPSQEARREPRAPNIVQRNNDAVVALVPKINLNRQELGEWVLSGRTAGEDFDLCPEEPFHNRLAAAKGTGVLVGKRTILTARHLFNGGDPVNLASFYFLFGYERNQTRFTDQDVFNGALAQVKDESPVLAEDWVLIELDREVGRVPVEIRASGQIGDEDEVYVIGHPLGVSKQAAGEAQVQNNTDPRHFFANLDVYERSSGSPVFNAEDHRLEGIVIAGDDPLFALPRRPCHRSRRCRGERCQGPVIRRISRITSSPAFQNRK